MKRVCTKCLVEKQLETNFYLRESRGYSYYDKKCISCVSSDRKQSYKPKLTPQTYILENQCYKFDITTRDKQKYWIYIDICDYDVVSKYRWNIDREGYVYSPVITNGKQTQLRLQRLIMNPSSDMVVDHINGNKLYNCRNNLRICTPAENSRNKKKYKMDGKSKYKGVHPLNSGKFVANIHCLDKKRHIGVFNTEKEAVEAYNKKAKELFGEFARLNVLS